MVRKHIITCLGWWDKKGATGQINYKSYFAKIWKRCKNLEIMGAKVELKSCKRDKKLNLQKGDVWGYPSSWLYLYQLEARRRDLMHINWSPQAGLLQESCQISHLDFIRPLNRTASKTDKLDLLLTSTAVSLTHRCFNSLFPLLTLIDVLFGKQSFSLQRRPCKPSIQQALRVETFSRSCW